MGTRARGGSWESADNGDADKADFSDSKDDDDVEDEDNDGDDKDDDDDNCTPLVISVGSRSAACANSARSVVKRWRANAARWRFSSSTRATRDECGDT